MFTFVSDLDHTLIYSHQKEGSCVEVLNGCGLTYMTPAAKQIFYRLLNQKDFLFIPCTARNFQQTSRVEFIKKLPYMVCDLGGSVYVDGKPDYRWKPLLRKGGYIAPDALEAEKMWVQKHLNSSYIKLHCNEDLFFVLSFKDRETAGYIFKKLKGRENGNIRYCLQGRKIYCIPVRLNKANAVQYLMEQYHIENIYTSGDSLFDEEFTKIGTALLPAHASIIHNTEYRTVASGMQAGEELIKQVEALYKKDIHPY